MAGSINYSSNSAPAFGALYALCLGWQEFLQHHDAMVVCMLCTAATEITRQTVCQALGADDAPCHG